MIEELGPRDVAAAVRLWQECGLTRPWNDPQADAVRALEGTASTVLAARVDGQLVGTVMVGVDGHRGWVYYLAVSPERRGEGWGRRLMVAAEDWMREQGAPKVQLMVRASNTAVLGFYAALGYTDQQAIVLGRFLDPELELLRRSATSEVASTIHVRRFAELTPDELYGILRLRSEVFVVEQNCVFLDLDDRDREPDAEHHWIDDNGAVVAALRVLGEPEGVLRISRVVTARSHRGRGLAGLLIAAVLKRHRGAEFVLDAQAHLTDFYGRQGFVPEGAEFVEDGIPHHSMRRPAG